MQAAEALAVPSNLNFPDRHRGQHKESEKNEHKTGLPLLWPPPHQRDPNSADCRPEKADD